LAVIKCEDESITVSPEFRKCTFHKMTNKRLKIPGKKKKHENECFF
jgi:hypothetical protein